MNANCAPACPKIVGLLSNNFGFSRSIAAIARCLLFCSALGEASVARAGGFLFDTPPLLVFTVSSDRRNNVFYEGERVVLRWEERYSTLSVDRYEIRDYWGNLVEAGPVVDRIYGIPIPLAFISPRVAKPGWYKVYLKGFQSIAPWGNDIGSSMFVILRNDPRFPTIPAQGASGGTEPASDGVIRGVVGSGPERHKMLRRPNGDWPGNWNPATWETSAQTIARLTPDIALEKTYYTPYDSYRPRPLLGAFPDGTRDASAIPAGSPNPALIDPRIAEVVQAFKNDVKYWEPRNEPNSNGVSGYNFFYYEMAPFYNTIKAIDPNLKVMGPGFLSDGGKNFGFLQDFLASGGASYIDIFSFHPYNNLNGDVFLARRSMDTILAYLTQYGAANKELWQTEQGFPAAVFGAYQPRLQGRWTMLMLMVFEQYGLPKEHNYLFYDRNHGFYDVPQWWVNIEGSLNPLACLMRVWSEELYGTHFTQRYNFGAVGEKLYLGSLFTGPGKKVAAFMSAGSTDGKIRLLVSDASVHVVSPFGDERDIPAVNGEVLLPVSEIPSYVRFSGSLSVAPIDWGTNIARNAVVTASGTGVHPDSGSFPQPIPNSSAKVVNGEFESWYWTQSFADNNMVWSDNTASFPAWVEIAFPQTAIDRVVIYSGVPYQLNSTLLDYDLEYDQNGQWVKLQTVKEPTRTFPSYSYVTRTTCDSFFSDRWVFVHSFPQVTTSKIRLFVRDTTWGGGATYDVVQAGGQTGKHHINLREVEVYASGTVDPANQAPIAGNDTASVDRSGVEIPVLQNDSDPDDGPQPLRVESTSVPSHGSVVVIGNRIRYTPVWDYSGADSFTYSVTDGLASATATVSVNVVPIAQPRTGGFSQLKGQYFSDTNLTNLVLIRYDAKIDFNWFGGSPDPAVPIDGFSVRWTGKLQPPRSGAYLFSTWADDGVRLWIDGQLAIDDWNYQGLIRHTWLTYLHEDRTYDVRLEYLEGGGYASVQLRWSHYLSPDNAPYDWVQPNAAAIPETAENTWRRSNFVASQLADPGISGSLAAPAGDGIPNLMKFAFRLNPLTSSAGSTALPRGSLLNEFGRDYLALTYRKNNSATGLSYNVWVSDSLSSDSWFRTALPEEFLGTDPGTGDPIIRRKLDVTGSGRKFIRLEIR